MLCRALESGGYTAIEARDEPEAVEQLRANGPSVVLSDLRLPRGDGFGVLRAAKEFDAETPVIVMTAYGSIQDAVRAMKEGALDFLAKPIDIDHLLLLVGRAVAQRRLVVEYLFLKEEVAARRGLPQIVGHAPALKQVSLAVQRAAGSDITVLIEGESGTGKELFARAVHVLSRRSGDPFVAINCAAIPEGLLETELFGHEKGAFTGAVGRKIGKFEVADGGTLFLDEIGDLSLPLQAKILRALEQRTFERVGGTGTVHVDVRVVAATNRDLRAAVAARRFREDLYFRLSVFPITVPPLRERTEDILPLARHFVERFCREMNKPAMSITDAAQQALEAYRWPGNVRELQNCMERAVILAEDDRLLVHHLNLHAADRPVAGPRDPWADVDLSGSLPDVRRRILAEIDCRKIRAALEEAGRDSGRAAEILQVDYRSLVAMLRQYKIDPS